MAQFGELQKADPERSIPALFVAANADLTLEASSVSSEWTTASEDEGAAPVSNFDQTTLKQGSLVAEAKKRRVRKWRVKHRLVKHRHLGVRSSSSSNKASSSGSSSDTSTTTSASESDLDLVNVPKTQRRQVRNERVMKSRVNAVELNRGAPPLDQMGKPVALQWVHGSKPHRHLAFALSFLSMDDIEDLHRAAKHPSVREIHDRKGYLAFKHRVVRFEMQLRALYPSLYSRLLELVRLSDTEGWQKLRKKKNKVYPEIEYIEYDVQVFNGECYIEPHVDNKSGVTLVAMLSPSGDYTGGNSCFRRGSGVEGHRQIRLEQGDAVMFRGEKLTHWITNVTHGRRVILQIELSRT
jgi:hypothetical protein